MFIEWYSETSCNPIHLNTTGRPSMFEEDTKRLTNNVFRYFDIEQFSFAHTVVNITAEVIVAPTPQYIWSWVAESLDLTGPQSQLVQPSTWAREAMFLMPDTITKISSMNTSSMSMWNSLDGYTTTLIRQAYLANWDMLHATFEKNDTAILTAAPQLQRQVALVSVKRVLRGRHWVFCWRQVGF